MGTEVMFPLAFSRRSNVSPSPFNLPALLILLASATLPARVVPNFSDLTIKTRRVDHLNSSVETLYLKGARQRREYLRDKPVNSSFVSISRCDDRKRIDLNDNAKLYAELPIVDRSEQRKRARPISTSEMTGEDVIVTTDSVDTGERRRMGTYTAGRLAT